MDQLLTISAKKWRLDFSPNYPDRLVRDDRSFLDHLVLALRSAGHDADVTRRLRPGSGQKDYSIKLRQGTERFYLGRIS